MDQYDNTPSQEKDQHNYYPEPIYEEPPPVQPTSTLNQWYNYIANDFTKNFETLSIYKEDKGEETLQVSSSIPNMPIEDHFRSCDQWSYMTTLITATSERDLQ